MSKFLYIFLLLTIAILLELVCGTPGLVIPIAAAVVFYLAACYGWPAGCICAVTSGLAIDLLYGRVVTLTPFSLGLVAIIAILWVRKTKSNLLIFLFVPGAVTGAIYSLPVLASGVLSTEITLTSLLLATSLAMLATAISSLLLPTLISALDLLSDNFEFDLYSDARDRLVERS